MNLLIKVARLFSIIIGLGILFNNNAEALPTCTKISNNTPPPITCDWKGGRNPDPNRKDCYGIISNYTYKCQAMGHNDCFMLASSKRCNPKARCGRNEACRLKDSTDPMKGCACW